ncbi:MAG: glutamate--tRNA ligase [Mariprofundales bacterium]
MNIRTRFAPSPTGMLHIGGARTALFAWLYAKHCGGQFVLRIEDTDRQRSTDAATKVILDGLAWLGITTDAEPVFQSQRVEQHKQAVQKLLATDQAYRCYCSRTELDAMRDAQRIAGQKPMYDGRCRHRNDNMADAPYVVRFRSPDIGETVVHDKVLGDVVFANNELDDLILMRSDGSPTYNLAVVVDDNDMAITHVIRGADHLNNTPRQIQLYNALGLKAPIFAHIPLIHGADGAKMSKRHGAVAITDYQQDGYLPHSVINYLARLSWSHGDQEIFSQQELIEKFDLAQVGKTAARFDQQKLDWLNTHYIHNSSFSELAPFIQNKLQDKLAQWHAENTPDMEQVFICVQQRSRSLDELIAGMSIFYQTPNEYNAKAVKKHMRPIVMPVVQDFISQAEQLEVWNKESLHLLLSKLCATHDVKLGKLAQPLRILLTGAAMSPPIDLTLELLGQNESMQRLKTGMSVLAH